MILAVGCTAGVQKSIIDGDPIVRAGPRDLFHSIDRPEMVPAAEADDRIVGYQPVVGVYDGVHARAYPTWHLENHEIVNDRLGELPIAATW